MMRTDVPSGRAGAEQSPQRRCGASASPRATVLRLQRAAGNRAVRRLLRREYGHESGISHAVALAKEAAKGHHLYDREHYLNARLTDPKEPRRADQLAQLRAVERAILNTSERQLPRLSRDPDVEQRIGARKTAIWAIGWKKSANDGLAWAAGQAKTPMAREQVALVREDMDFVKKRFKHEASRNAYALLDASWNRVEEVVTSYGLWSAYGGTLAKNVAFGYMTVEEATDSWLERAQSYARFKESAGARSDLGKRVPALADLQQKHRRLVKEYEKKYSLNPLTQDPATLVVNVVGQATEGKEPRRKALEKIAKAKARLEAAWAEAEALHPILAAYREEDVRDLLGAGSKTDAAAVRSMIATCIDRLSNIIYARAALQQGKVSALQLGPIVALTRSQMLIRRDSYWGYAIEDLVKEDKGDAEFVKQVLNVVIAALSLLPGGQVVALLGLALDLHTAGTEYVQYGLDKAMAGTDLDRALALSDKTPSLAGFAFALLSAGMNLGAARAAMREAEPFAAGALKGETEAIEQLNKIGAKHGVKDLGKQVASKSKASPKPHPSPRSGGGAPPSAGKPLTEDEWLKARKPKSARPYNARPTKGSRLPPARRKPSAQQIEQDVSDLVNRGEGYAEALREAEKTKATLGKEVAEKAAEAENAKRVGDAKGYHKARGEREALEEKWEDAQAEFLTQQQNIRQVKDEIDRVYKEALEDVPRLDPKVDKAFTREKRRPNFGREGPTNADDVVVTSAPLRDDALKELDKLLADPKLTVQQQGNEFAALLGRHEGWTSIAEIFRAQHGRIGRRWDFGNTKEITIEGRLGKLGDHKLDQLWFDLNHHGSVDLTVPALSGTAREQLARLAGEWRKWNPGKKPSIMVRVVGR